MVTVANRVPIPVTTVTTLWPASFPDRHRRSPIRSGWSESFRANGRASIGMAQMKAIVPGVRDSVTPEACRTWLGWPSAEFSAGYLSPSSAEHAGHCPQPLWACSCWAA